MSDLDIMREKFFVIKFEDIEKYFENEDLVMFTLLLQKIIYGRQKDNKKENRYIVVDVDEPYIGEIAEIMKKHKQ